MVVANFVTTTFERDKGEEKISTYRNHFYKLFDLHFDDADCKFMSSDWIDPQEQFCIMYNCWKRKGVDVGTNPMSAPFYILVTSGKNKIAQKPWQVHLARDIINAK